MSDKRSELCRGCGKRVRICIPKGGDGSVDIYVRHRNQSGDYCPQSRMIVERKKCRE